MAQDSNDDYDFDTDAGRGTAVDVKLFKAIGLHQLLRRWWPADPDGRGGGHSCRGLLRFALGLWFSVLLVQVAGLYHTRADVQRFAFISVILSTSLLDLWKGYLVAWHADELRALLRPPAHRSDDEWLHECRVAVSAVVRAFTAFSCCGYVLWLATPWLLIVTHHDGRYVPFTRADGTVSEYRVSVYNMWWPVSAAEYNRPAVWFCVYVFEAFGCALNVFTWLLFDCYVITVCYTLHAHFRDASTGYAALGRAHHSSASDGATSSPADQTGGVTAGDAIEPDADAYHFDELISHIKDTQKLMKKFDEFFDLVQPVVLAQIGLGSYTVIIFIFLTSMTYIAGFSIISVPFLKLFAGFCILTLEHYLYCYLFNYVETAKATVNFGLYSSNWTEMNLKFRKTLLLEMCLNSSHRRAMKVSPTSIVNLEMFTRVMRMSYSIVSVLLNAQK